MSSNYFKATARRVFTDACGDPDNATELAAWAEALRTGPTFDFRIGVIVAEDGTLLAQTRHTPATGWSPGATYVTDLLVPITDRLVGLEVGLALGALRRATGQGVIHVKASQVCTGSGAFLGREQGS